MSNEFKPYDNGWLLDIIKQSELVDKRIFGDLTNIDYRIQCIFPEISTFVFRSIANYAGSKALLSFTFRDPDRGRGQEEFSRIIKILLCLFDLVILVPAPLPPSCHIWKYSEWSSGGSDYLDVFLSDDINFIAMPVLLKEKAAIKSGAVTLLPMCEGPFRWSHPFLRLPDLPYLSNHAPPVNGAPDFPALIADGIAHLTLERLVAERLGATHINCLSFGDIYCNDLLFNCTPDRRFKKAIFRLKLPSFCDIELQELIALRSDLQESRHNFSLHLFQRLRSAIPPSGELADSEVDLLSEELYGQASRLRDSYMEVISQSKFLASRAIIKSTVFALGAAHLLGSASQAISFLFGGGTAWEIVDMISKWRSTKLKIRSNSLFFAAEMLRKHP